MRGKNARRPTRQSPENRVCRERVKRHIIARPNLLRRFRLSQLIVLQHMSSLNRLLQPKILLYCRNCFEELGNILT